MNLNLLTKVILILIIPIFLFSENNQKEAVKLIKTEKSIEVQKTPSAEKNEENVSEEENKSSIEKQIEQNASSAQTNQSYLQILIIKAI